MDRSFANGNGNSTANGQSTFNGPGGDGTDYRSLTFWDLIGQGRVYQ